MTRNNSLATAIVSLAVVTLVACASAVGSDPGSGNRTVDEARATELAQRALEALNAGDYAGWSEHWSDDMKAAVKEENFLAFREQVMTNLGPFVAIEGVETTSVEPGTYRYIFTLTFERGDTKLAFGFVEGSDLIHGVFVV